MAIDSSTLETDETSVPVRLPINSTHVLHELSKISTWVSELDGSRVEQFEHRNVVIMPWNPFVTYHDATTERLETLKRLQSQRGATGKADEDLALAEESKEDPIREESSDQQQKETKPMESYEDYEDELQPCEACGVADPPHKTPLKCLKMRINHLQCLVDFLCNDLKQVFELRRDLAAGKVHDIAFEDLSISSNPGDVIVSPNAKLTGSSILAVAGMATSRTCLLRFALTFDSNRFLTGIRLLFKSSSASLLTRLLGWLTSTTSGSSGGGAEL